MGKRGPKAKPTKLKVLEGNRGKRPLPKNEPEPKSDFGDAPDYLDDLAREEWARLAPSLREHGLLTAWDRAPFSAYCDAFSRWARATLELNKLGSLVQIVGEKDYEQQHPMVSIQLRYFEVMRKTAALFGFSPSDRTGLEVKAPTKESPMARLLKEAK